MRTIAEIHQRIKELEEHNRTFKDEIRKIMANSLSLSVMVHKNSIKQNQAQIHTLKWVLGEE